MPEDSITDTDTPLYRQLDVELADRLTESAFRCDDRDVRDLRRSEVVRVSAFDVGTAARCQAKAAVIPDPFEPGIFTTTRAVALRAVRWLRRTNSVVEAVSETMRQARRADRGPGDGPVPDEDWLGQYLEAAPVDVRVRIAARAITWLSTVLVALDVEDLSETRRWRYDLPQRWRYPGRGLALEGKVDLALPAVDGAAPSFRPVFVVGGTHPAAMDQAAYNICLWTIKQRQPPYQVGLIELPTSSVHWFSPDDLYQQGLDAAARAAHAVTRRAGEPAAVDVDLTFNPAPFTCQGCARSPICQARSEAELLPVRKGGVRLT